MDEIVVKHPQDVGDAIELDNATRHFYEQLVKYLPKLEVLNNRRVAIKANGVQLDWVPDNVPELTVTFLLLDKEIHNGTDLP